MTRSRIPMTFSAAALFAAALPAAAQYNEVFNEAEANNGVFTNPFLDTVAVGPDGTAYAALRELGRDGNNDAINGGLLVAYDGSTFTTVMTPAQFDAAATGFDIAAGNGAGIVGNKFRAVNFFNNSVYEIDLSTGDYTEVVSTADLSLAAGGIVNMGAQFEVAADGTIFAIDSATDQVLKISPTNAVTVEIGAADYASLLGTSIGGIGISGDSLLIGSNSNDSLIAWDTTEGAGATLLTTGQIDAVTDDVDGVVSFGDILDDGNGNVFLYEGDSDFVLSFELAAAASTIGVVLTEADLNAPDFGSDTINQLSIYNNELAWTDGSLGFYAVPEPAAAVLLAAGGLALLRRRRA